MKRYSDAEAARAGKQFLIAVVVGAVAVGVAGIVAGWGGLFASCGTVLLAWS